MTRPDTITTSQRELDRCKLIEAVVPDGLQRGSGNRSLSRDVPRLRFRILSDCTAPFGKSETLVSSG